MFYQLLRLLYQILRVFVFIGLDHILDFIMVISNEVKTLVSNAIEAVKIEITANLPGKLTR